MNIGEFLLERLSYLKKNDTKFRDISDGVDKSIKKLELSLLSQQWNIIADGEENISDY